MSTEATTAPSPSLTEQVKQVIVANPEGLTAPQIAQSLGMIGEGTTKEDAAKATKKVRIAARKATAGTTRSKNGRNTVYRIPAAV